jgi:uncharacterized membrane protein YdbT with pleckstrin-like domain
LSFTRYSLQATKFIVKKGFFTLVEDEILLYRVLDIRLVRTLGQRILGLGTIVVMSGDASSPEYHIKNVKRSEQVRDLFSKLVDEERTKLKLKGRELSGVADDDQFSDAGGQE